MAPVQEVPKHFDLWRVSTGPGGTVGWMEITGIPGIMAYTLEQPWNQNRRDDPRTAFDESSCIPPGEYNAVVEKHKIWPRVVRLSGIPGRDGILIHSGNTIADSIGCILVGETAAMQHLIQFPSLTRSRATLARLCSALGPGVHRLHIHTIAESHMRGCA